MWICSVCEPINVTVIGLTCKALKQQMLSNMVRLRGYPENGSIQNGNGGSSYTKDTKSRQSSTPPSKNMFLPPVVPEKVTSNIIKNNNKEKVWPHWHSS